MFTKIVFLKDFFIYCLLKTPAGQDSSIGRRYILQNLLVNSLFAQARAGVIIEADLIKFSKKLVKLYKEHINFIFILFYHRKTYLNASPRWGPDNNRFGLIAAVTVFTVLLVRHICQLHKALRLHNRHAKLFGNGGTKG